MSNEAWSELHAEPKIAEVMHQPEGPVRSNFTKGGMNYFTKFEYKNIHESDEMYKNRDGYYGWYGYGGSIFQWHPDLRIGFAFVPTLLQTFENQPKRGAVLQNLVKECAEKRNI